jgi:hypothetical protein
MSDNEIIQNYKRSYKILPEAKLASYDPNITRGDVEFHMKELFHHPRLTLEMVQVYNRLERTWKLLTGYIDTEASLI